MPWDLKIHTFDVGQGESCLIDAQDAVRRIMLIDGGKADRGRIVNECINNLIGVGTAVDHIVVSHYDNDHCGGIMVLLAADNFYAICDTVAQVAANEAAMGQNRLERIAAGAAGACAAFLGAYAIAGGANSYALAALSGNSARAEVRAGAANNNNDAAIVGIKKAEEIVCLTPLPLNPRLIPSNSNKKRRDVSKIAGIAAADAINQGLAGANVQARVRAAVFNSLKNFIKNIYDISTGGRYRETHVIDTGASPGLPGEYVDLVNGRIMMANNAWIQAPGVRRQRTTPALGSEILWNPGLTPVSAPAIFVMARNSSVWNNPVPIAIGIDNNNDSIGLMLRFNNFFFYTGGDLITMGEDFIADAIMANGLPNPAGGFFPIPHRIAAFKCGHHGADTCTSNYFLNKIQPCCALISCGENSFNHPNQNLVNRLHLSPAIERFYLTGCAFDRNHIPASNHPPGNQLTTPGNKSRVAGEDRVISGSITLSINENESRSRSPLLPLTSGDTALRQFHIRYFERDARAIRTETIIF